MPELFKLAFYADDGTPLKVPQQAAVIGELGDRSAKEMREVVLQYFLDAVADEDLEEATKATIVRMDLAPSGAPLPKKKIIAKEQLHGSTLTVRLTHVDFFKSDDPPSTSLVALPWSGTPGGFWSQQPTRGRKSKAVALQHLACAVCNKIPESTVAMVAMDCGEAFCEPCLAATLGCQCRFQGISWLAPCPCTAPCPQCQAPLSRRDFKAVREPTEMVTMPKAWRFLVKDSFVCECGASETPRYSLPGYNPDRKGRWCELCPTKPANAVDVTNKTCECGMGICMMGMPGDERKHARWCRNCPMKPAEAITLVWKRCECGHCEPYFGLPGERRGLARWCSRCPTKPPEAVDIVHKRCECGAHRPSMGLPGGGKKDAKWCGSCPTLPAIAVNLLTCKCECGRVRPTYAYPGEGKKDAKWCATCPSRPEGTIDIVTLRCRCGKRQAYFGLPWDSAGKAKWCSGCPDIPPMAVDVRHKKCECGLSKANYCLPSDVGVTGAAKWCHNCKPAGATRFYQNKCECGRTQPSYGITGMKVNGRMAVWCTKCPTKPAAAVVVTKIYKKRKAS